MDTKKLLSNTVLYGFGDVVVLAVGSLLLIPLYTRSLTQEEYGVYSIVKVNTDVLVYLVHFGLVSAISRLYFEYKAKGEHYQYLSSVLITFFVIAFIYSLFALVGGEFFWELLSPEVQAFPYLIICFSIAFFSFFSYVALMWLRVEEKVSVFVAIQVASACLLVLLVIYNLVIAENGLNGLLYSLVANAICSALALPVLLWKKLSFTIKKEHVVASFRFGLPILVGYCGYFVLNRGSLVVLQRYVGVDQVAIFSLGQQMAMVMIMASNALAKSLQPVVYAAEVEELAGVVQRSGKIYFLLTACLANLTILFASDILSIAAPSGYSDSYYVFIILIVANFIYSSNFIPSTVLLYHKHSMTSVAVTLFGGGVALVANLILVPKYHLFGAAFSMLFAFCCVLFFGFFAARKLLDNMGAGFLFGSLPLMLITVFVASLVKTSQLGVLSSLMIKAVLSLCLLWGTYVLYRRCSGVTA